jgi:RNA polymerase sigma factor (sigma-70 family)
MTAEEAVTWVNRNKGMIIAETKKYQLFTPYDRKDFVQDAYEAAIVAAVLANRKGLAFEGCFWRIFQRNVSNLVPNPDARGHAGSNSPGVHLCVDVDLLENVLPCPEEPTGSEIDPSRLFLAVCDHLSANEKQVWKRALGVTAKGRMSQYEIAEELGCSVANVRQTVQRVIKRLSALTRAGTLRLKTEDVEVRQLSLVFGLSRLTPAEGLGLEGDPSEGVAIGNLTWKRG